MYVDTSYGPNTAEVRAFIGSLRSFTPEQWNTVLAEQTARREDAAVTAARSAAHGAGRNDAVARVLVAASYAAWNAHMTRAHFAAEDAAVAIVVADLITTEEFDRLVAPMRSAGAAVPDHTRATEKEN